MQFFFSFLEVCAIHHILNGTTHNKRNRKFKISKIVIQKYTTVSSFVSRIQMIQLGLS